MKSMVLAIVLLLGCVGFCYWNTGNVIDMLDGMHGLAEAIPKEVADLEAASDSLQLRALQLSEQWAHLMPRLAYVCSYQALNRADEAMVELCASLRASQYPEVLAARDKLLDTLRRLLALEGVSFGSIF